MIVHDFVLGLAVVSATVLSGWLVMDRVHLLVCMGREHSDNARQRQTVQSS